jgi:hypothetical protein
MSDFYLLDAGWLFFAAWGVVVLLVSWSAFGHDIFPSAHRMDLPPQSKAQTGKELPGHR